MANPLDANELIKQGQTRTFYQPGGPGTSMYFFGLDTSYHFIDSAEMPSNGTIDPVFVPDPRRPNRYKLVARQIGAPDLPTVSLVFHEQWGGIPRALMAPKCEFNLYEVHSRCADLSDFYRGWDSYVLIYSGFRFEAGIDLGTRTAADSDEGLTANIDAKGAAIYPVGALGFGEEAATAVTTEVVDAVYGTSLTCGDCGVENDGSKFIYTIAKKFNVASASQNMDVVYSIDGGVSWTNSTVDNAANLLPVFIDIAGSTLFVGVHSGSDTKIYYTNVEPLTGEITGTWASFTITSVKLTDVWVKSSRSIWFSSSTSGGIYKTTDITTTPTLIDNGVGGSNVLNRIAGANDVIVAVGGVSGSSGIVRYSSNGGATWTSITDATIDTSAGDNCSIDDAFTALAVLDNTTWYIGSNDSYLVYTKTGGVKWKKLTMPDEGSASYGISDIVFPTREVAWIAQNKTSATTAGILYTTIDGGNTIVKYNATSRIVNYPNASISKINRFAVPYLAEPAVAANYLTVVGLAPSDGIVLSAAPTIV
jgi:hypothetical protein